MDHDMTQPPTGAEIEGILKNPGESRWVIKEFEYWRLYLNARDQILPGRSYAWLKKRHIDRMSISELYPKELEELVFQIVPAFEEAITSLWPVATVNFEWLGNSTRHHRGHGHAHLIPRFSRPFEFRGESFEDTKPQERRTQERRQLPDGVLEAIRFEIKNNMER